MVLWRHRFSQKATQLFEGFLPYYIRLCNWAEIIEIIALLFGRNFFHKIIHKVHIPTIAVVFIWNSETNYWLLCLEIYLLSICLKLHVYVCIANVMTYNYPNKSIFIIKIRTVIRISILIVVEINKWKW